MQFQFLARGALRGSCLCAATVRAGGEGQERSSRPVMGLRARVSLSRSLSRSVGSPSLLCLPLGRRSLARSHKRWKRLLASAKEPHGGRTPAKPARAPCSTGCGAESPRVRRGARPRTACTDRARRMWFYFSLRGVLQDMHPGRGRGQGQSGARQTSLAHSLTPVHLPASHALRLGGGARQRGHPAREAAPQRLRDRRGAHQGSDEPGCGESGRRRRRRERGGVPPTFPLTSPSLSPLSLTSPSLTSIVFRASPSSRRRGT